jgi:hypothetical protein
MTKVAHCACGLLRVEVAGNPTFAGICHCEPCQRRTGSVFSVNAYYKRSDAKISGKETVFIREGQEGRKVQNRFCPTCGTTVYWEADFRPGDIGVAVGAFFDPAFPCPERSVYEESMHDWVSIEDATTHLPRGRPTVKQA